MTVKNNQDPDFSARLLKSLGRANGTENDDIRVISIALWFEKVRVYLNLPSAYVIEITLKPLGVDRGGKLDCNWSKYAVGSRKPAKWRVEFVETIVPGSARLLAHPLWLILCRPPATLLEIEKAARMLDGDIQSILLGSVSQAQRGSVITKRKLDMLKRRASLDALAGLVLLAWKETLLGQSENALRICETIYQVLLIVCLQSPFRLLVREIFNCFQRHVFSAIRHNSFQIEVSTYDCKALVELLDLAIRQTRNPLSRDCSQAQLVKLCCELIDVRNLDVMSAVAAPIVNVGGEADSEFIDARELARFQGVLNILGRSDESVGPSSRQASELLCADEPLEVPLGSGGMLYLQGRSIRFYP